MRRSSLPNRILELHGDVHRYQCAKPCSQTLWQDKPPDLSIDLETLRASGKLPHCPECGGMARPNVMMFGDTAWVPDAVREQRERYADWLASVRGRRVVILELGAGKAIPSIRRLGEDLATRDVATLVRINPDATRCGRAGGAGADGGTRGVEADRGGVIGGIQGTLSSGGRAGTGPAFARGDQPPHR